MRAGETCLKPRRQEAGMALLTALLISLVLAVVAAGVVTYTTAGSQRTVHETSRREALNLAESAVEWAIAELDPANLDTASASAVPFGSGTYTVSARRLPDGEIAIQATGAHGRAARTVEVILIEQANPMGDYAIATDGQLTFNGAVTVNSTPSAGVGNVHSNEAVVINGSSPTFDGTITSGGSVTPSTYPNATGGVRQNSPEVEIPTYSAAQLSAFRTEAQASGNLTMAGFNGTALSGYYSGPGNLRINGGTVTLAGPVVYIDGDLTISGNSVVNAPSGALVIVSGTVSISGNPDLIGPAGGGLGIVSLASGTAFDLGGADQIRGQLYAPNGSIDVHGNVSVHGSLIARGVGIVKGSVVLTRDTTSTAEVFQQPFLMTQSWREVD